MAFANPLQDYARSPQPVLPESQARYLQEELRKLEQTLKTVTEALKQLDARLTAHSM
jgi:hypothetical protein